MEIRLSCILLAAVLLSGCGWFHRGRQGAARSRGRRTPGRADHRRAPGHAPRRQDSAYQGERLRIGRLLRRTQHRRFRHQSALWRARRIPRVRGHFPGRILGAVQGGTSSLEDVFPDITVVSDSGRHFTYYDLDVGYNMLPGEMFLGRGTRVQFGAVCDGRHGRREVCRQGPVRAEFWSGYAASDHRLAGAARGCARPRVRDQLVGTSPRTSHNIEGTIGLTTFSSRPIEESGNPC